MILQFIFTKRWPGWDNISPDRVVYCGLWTCNIGIILSFPYHSMLDPRSPGSRRSPHAGFSSNQARLGKALALSHTLLCGATLTLHTHDTQSTHKHSHTEAACSISASDPDQCKGRLHTVLPLAPGFVFVCCLGWGFGGMGRCFPNNRKMNEKKVAAATCRSFLSQDSPNRP